MRLPLMAASTSAVRCRFPFQYRQAVGVWLQAAPEHGVTVQQQVMRGNGGGNAVGGIGYKIHAVARGYMFQHHLERRVAHG